MKNKILLIHPKNESNYVVYPLGCLYLSAYLLRAGYQPIILDGNEIEDYVGFIDSNIEDVLCIGISAITGSQVKYGLLMAEYVKRKYANIPVVWGGRHVSSLPENSLLDYRVDIVVRGEGEETFLELVGAFSKGEPIKDVLGISYKCNGKIIANGDRSPMDLDNMPRIPWELIDVEKKMNHPSGKHLSIQTGRDCPFSCTYCSHKKVTIDKYRGISPKYIFDNIEPLIKKYNVKHVSFYEPHFISQPSRVEEFCKEILKRNIRITWDSSARANTFVGFDPGILNLMKQSGCNRVCFGFESGSSEVLVKINKLIVPDQIIKSVELCRKLDIVCEACFMAGFPFEKLSDVFKTMFMISRIQKIWSKTIFHIQSYTPFPNTILYQECKDKYNLKESTEMRWWGEYSNIKNNTPWLGFIMKKFIKMLSLTIYLSDLAYLKSRKDIRFVVVMHNLTKVFYSALFLCNFLFKKEFLEKKC